MSIKHGWHLLVNTGMMVGKMVTYYVRARMWNEIQEQIRLQQANRNVSGAHLVCGLNSTDPLLSDLSADPLPTPLVSFFLSFFSVSKRSKVKWAGWWKHRFTDSLKRNVSIFFRSFLGESTLKGWTVRLSLAQVSELPPCLAAEMLLLLGNGSSHFSNLSLLLFINVCLYLGHNYTYISEYFRSHEKPYFHMFKLQTQ